MGTPEKKEDIPKQELRKICEDVGKIVKDHRFFNDQFQEDFAKKIGITQAAISMLENGKKITSLKNIIDIAYAAKKEIVIHINPSEETTRAYSVGNDR